MTQFFNMQLHADTEFILTLPSGKMLSLKIQLEPEFSDEIVTLSRIIPPNHYRRNLVHPFFTVRDE